MLIISPHATAVVNNDNDDNDCRHGRGVGCHALPPSGPSRPAGCPSFTLSMLPTAVDGGGKEGVWGVVLPVVEEDEVRTIVFDCQVTIQPGVDDGGKRSSVTSVRLRGRQRQAGDGGGEGAAPRGPRR
jgi:hypothetical protein